MIAFISKNSPDTLQALSETALKLKPWVKMPLFFHGLDVGLAVSIQIQLSKMTGGLLQIGEAVNYGLLFDAMIALNLIFTVYQIRKLNRLMRDYDQLDVMLIYKSYMMTLPILTGLFLNGEIALYGTWELVRLFCGVAFCIAGVTIISYKNKDAGRQVDQPTVLHKIDEEASFNSGVAPG